MYIIAVEQSADDLAVLTRALRETYPQAEVAGFTDPLMAMKVCGGIQPQLLVCGFCLRLIDGLSLAQLFRRRLPELPVVLVDEGAWHESDARNLMIGYVARPVTAEKLRPKC